MVIVRRFLLLLPLVLLATSCSAANTLATVNGTEITKDDLTVLRPSYSEPTSLDAERVREDLTRLIIVAAIEEAAAEQFGSRSPSWRKMPGALKRCLRIGPRK